MKQGKRSPSISHLSSLWATTVASKPGLEESSLHDFDKNNADDEKGIPRQQVIELPDEDNFESENNNLLIEKWREATAALSNESITSSFSTPRDRDLLS